jgi:drug/metabolite transporter (DMT)-like permease
LTKGNNLSGGLFMEYKAELLLLFVTLTWGMSFPLIKIMLIDVSPFMLVFTRFSLTFLLFVILYRKEIEFLNVKAWLSGLFLGLFLFLGYTSQTLGLVYTSASKSAFITGINLIFIPFIQYIVLRLKPGLFNVIGAVLVMTGLYLFTGTHLGAPNVGDILTIFCAISFAIHIVLLTKFSENTEFVHLAYGQFLGITLLSLLAVLLLEERYYNEVRFNMNLTSGLYLLFTAIISTLLSLILMTKYQKFTTPFRAGIIYNFEAVFAAVFAYYLLNETMNRTQVIAVSVMLTGLMISEFGGFLKNRRINETSKD